MALVQVSVSVPKELSEVANLIVELVKDVKAGKDISKIGEENLSNLLKAIEGVDQIPQEVKDNVGESAVCAGLLGGQVIAELVKPKSIPL